MQDFTLDYALLLDAQDSLALYREQFHFPQLNGQSAIYLCGNSLGLQPINAAIEIKKVLKDWSKRGVEGHFEGKNDWIGYNDRIKPMLAMVVGASSAEVAIMNTLTVNLHMLMVSFYRPTSRRYKIITEQHAFPSDTYALKSQLRHHGLDPAEALVTVHSCKENDLLNWEDWKLVIDQHADTACLLMAGGINYYTGQLHEIEKITKYAQSKGLLVGWDLAHAVGNVELTLHDWNVDFAVWCHYKYLNAGPGAIAGAFVHEKYHDKLVPKLEGWWGNALASRFKMEDDIMPACGAEAWVCSTPPTLAIAPLKASLELLTKATLSKVIHKSRHLTGYLEELIIHLNNDRIELITPSDKNKRGSQISIRIKRGEKKIFNTLIHLGVICDWREPDVIRMAPNALYNSFEDVYKAVRFLNAAVSE